MQVETLTYAMLLDEQNRQVARGEMNPQTAANRATALRAFLRANHIAEADVVGSEMRTQYPRAVECLVLEQQAQGRSGRSLSNTRAALTPWKNAVIALDEIRAIANDAPTPFQVEVKNLIGNCPVKRVARQTGVPPDMLRGWLKGRKPQSVNVAHVRRIEHFFGLQRDSLVSLAGILNKSRGRTPIEDAAPIEYRSTLGERTQDQFWLRPSEASPLRRQWTELMSYKTDFAPDLERSEAGRWSFAPIPVVKPSPANWWMFLDGVEVPSAKSGWAKVAGYLGWLSLPQERGGAAIPVAELQTLAWLATPGYLKPFCEWVKKRGGKYTHGILEFFGLMGWMLRPGDGYLFQRPELLVTLPTRFHTKNWKDMCIEQYQACLKFKKSLRSLVRKGRNPFEPMSHIIELPDPLEAVADMVQRMRRDRPIASPTAEAIWSRDMFLIKLLTTNPLRLRNIATLCYSPKYKDGRKPDDRPALYQRTDGSWWIFVPKHLLKNRRGPAVHDYDAPVHASATLDLERYLFRHRNTLVRTPTELAFLVADKGGNFSDDHWMTRDSPEADASHFPSLYLSRRVMALTRKYLWRCDGIGTHAFRHIVATAILKSEDGDIKTAALVLNDRESTVEKHYAGIRSGDGAKRMGEILGAALSRM
ncbi:hypothetical protein PTE30175_03578 [Pandoraea terrae]|uniref:Uncharacterized protein n=1 Tax=Pandoraea terrae TaxID=1537710 RepID=A0A5E4X570_9BURK|nr:hypothetical protein [Pandoraea terrae]VVE31501.1 hypothetical protein PTE30175_03578 [Pandoraea terrae]